MEKKVEEIEKEVKMLKGLLSKIFNLDNLDTSKFENEIKELKSKNRELEDKNSEMKNKISVLEEKSDKLNKKVENLKEDKLKLLEELKKSPIKEIQNIYNSLSEKQKDNCKNILINRDELTLLASAVLHIDSLFEQVKHQIIENDDLKMVPLFYAVFDIYKDVENYKYQEVEIGEKFDSEKYVRTPKSDRRGEIVEVVLKGYQKRGKLIKESVVVVKG